MLLPARHFAARVSCGPAVIIRPRSRPATTATRTRLRAWGAIGLVWMVLCAAQLGAAVRLASPFTSHMVLQCDTRVPVWGTAAAGEQVTVAFAGQSHAVTAAADGTWRVALDPLPASAEGRVLAVSGSGTSSPLQLEDVVVGEVWLASGQSNMDFTVARTAKYYFAGVTNEAAEIAAAHHPLIRMFTGEWTRRYEPQGQVAGAWKVCTPENVREFSAVGYFFARRLRQELKAPVGILTLTYGASTAQAWIRREAIAAQPRLKPVLDEFDAQMAAYRTNTAAQARFDAALERWETNAAAARAAGRPPPRRPRNPDPADDQHHPTVLFNGMIAPVVPFAIRGVLWYQGESMTGPRELFPLWTETLIRDWRQLWQRELPFYFCQLAAYPNASNDPEVREMQAAALQLPHTGMAVTIDIGDEKNVHPVNKQDVGARLARIALACVYGRPLEYSGPQFESVSTEGAALRLKFSHLGGGLLAKGGALKTFEIAGADGKYVPAEAHIDGDAIRVASPNVPAPVAARYAWSSYPEGCNLYNAAGLPAAPFRTDRKSP
jgi:sialate O-acetylesterase